MNRSDRIITLGKSLGKDPIIACIGSTKIISDCFGPIVGQLLTEKYRVKANVVGTLFAPLHAVNLTERLFSAVNEHPLSKVIAVDACEINENRDLIRIIDGGIKPGLASGKDLPRIGDISIVASSYKYNGNLHCLGRIYRLADTVAKLIDFMIAQSNEQSAKEQQIHSSYYRNYNTCS